MNIQSVVYWDVKLGILIGEDYYFAGTSPSLIISVGVTDPESRDGRFLRGAGAHTEDYATQPSRQSVHLADWFSKTLPRNEAL
jgi:hypothetical protein